MSPMSIDRRLFLRHSLTAGLAAAVLSELGSASARHPKQRAVADRQRPLSPTPDASTGRYLLRLPEGFRYFSFAWSGERLASGGVIPTAADGMGVVASSGSRLTLVRNHEIAQTLGAFDATDLAYDPHCGGGCVRLHVDLDAERMISAEVGLSGTLVNCAGGVSPWGTWLSCEEIAVAREQTHRPPPLARKSPLSQAHGLVFEVAASGSARARPIEAMGIFRHEAVAVDAESGAVYLTEDRDPEAGFYRFTPRVRGDLHQGGRLEMLKAHRAPDLRRGQRVGSQLPVSWVPIDDPGRCHSTGTFDQGGVVMQGLAHGASRFLRLEGCLMRSDGCWFTSTSGGDAGAGQVWRLNTAANLLELMFEVSDRSRIDYPDNICEGPGDPGNGAAGERSGIVICEDSTRRTRQKLLWLGRDARLLTIAENMTQVDRVDYGASEWAGCCVSPDGKWLFANVQRPGFSVAITGPWDEWLSA